MKEILKSSKHLPNIKYIPYSTTFAPFFIFYATLKEDGEVYEHYQQF